MDVAVSGKKFGASGVPSLKEFIREIAKAVPSPQGGTVYDAWKKASQPNPRRQLHPQETSTFRPPPAAMQNDVPVGDLGSGSDYSVFLQHLGVPSTDISSTGDYGVYHSVFDNFAWFKKFGDPDFLYEQQMARIYGLEILRMSSADVLPYDYENYGKEILVYLESARYKSKDRFGDKAPGLFGSPGRRAPAAGSGRKNAAKTTENAGAPERMNAKLRDAERALLIPEGLAQPSVVSPCHLRSGTIHRICSGGDSWSERGD